MHPFFIYSIQVNIALALFCLLYVSVLKRDTFFGLRRFFLLSVIFFSLLYPLLEVPPLGEAWRSYFSDTRETNIAVFIGNPSIEGVDGEEAAAAVSIPWMTLLAVLYVAGVCMLLVRFLVQLASIYRIRSRSEKQTIAGFDVYHLEEEITPFSFFNLIFIHTEMHSEKELSQILLHERIHTKQGHSVDVILAELICIFFWWNPFAWLMKREITINLEYLADNDVLREGIDTREYQYHLLRLTYHESAVPIVNNFNVSQLKQRIMVMNKTKTPALRLVKYLAVLPLVLLFVTANSVYAAQNATEVALPEPPPVKKESVKKENKVDIVASEEKKQAAKEVNDPNDPVFEVVEINPEYEGGIEALQQYLRDNIRYPVKAQEKGIQGRVICRFVVRKDGVVTNVEVLRNIDPLLDAEAVRVIESMPDWKPGTQRGKPVSVYFTIPISFNLNKEKPADEKTDTNKENEKDFVKFVADNIRYPVIAQENGIQGLVKASYSVNEKGEISNVKIVEGVDPSLDKEVIRIIERLPADATLKREGEKANPEATLSVLFRLQGEGVSTIVPVESDVVVVGYGVPQ